MSYINEGFMVVWHDDRVVKPMIQQQEVPDRVVLRHTGELRFKVRAVEALQQFGMHEAAQLVMQLPTSGNE